MIQGIFLALTVFLLLATVVMLFQYWAFFMALFVVILHIASTFLGVLVTFWPAIAIFIIGVFVYLRNKS